MTALYASPILLCIEGFDHVNSPHRRTNNAARVSDTVQETKRLTRCDPRGASQTLAIIDSGNGL